MKNQSMFRIAIVFVVALALAGYAFNASARSLDATAPPLGDFKNFSVLGAQSVDSTGATVLNGDLGISPGDASSITGFPPGLYTGTLHAADALAGLAQVAATNAVTALNSQPCTSNLTGQDLGGLTLVPGVYCFDNAAELTGNLILDAQGDPNAVWIFKMESTLTTGTSSTVTYINSPSKLCNVYWRVGSSATLGEGTEFIGTIIANISVTLVTNANIEGRAIAQTGSVTLDDNTITPIFCVVAPTPVPTSTTEIDYPTATVLPGLPDAGGGAPIRDGNSPFSFMLIVGASILALALGGFILRRTISAK